MEAPQHLEQRTFLNVLFAQLARFPMSRLLCARNVHQEPMKLREVLAPLVPQERLLQKDQRIKMLVLDVQLDIFLLCLEASVLYVQQALLNRERLIVRNALEELSPLEEPREVVPPVNQEIQLFAGNVLLVILEEEKMGNVLNVLVEVFRFKQVLRIAQNALKELFMLIQRIVGLQER